MHNIDINNSELKNKENIQSKISRDIINMNSSDSSPYYYESYVVYKNKKYKSETVNIGEDGLRKIYHIITNQPLRKIIIFGSSEHLQYLASLIQMIGLYLLACNIIYRITLTIILL